MKNWTTTMNAKNLIGKRYTSIKYGQAHWIRTIKEVTHEITITPEGTITCETYVSHWIKNSIVWKPYYKYNIKDIKIIK